MNKQERQQMLIEKLAKMQEYENALYTQGATYIAGVDEVGRGPLAGPVVSAAVILPPKFEILGVDDSKKLSEKKRNELFVVIKEQAVAYGIGMIDPAVIDEINILEATKKSMIIAIEEAQKLLYEKMGSADAQIGHVLFDALTIEDVEIPQTPIVKGDSKSISIAAASILAKVTRDAIMIKYHEQYPQYAFNTNKGYGTKEHYEGLATAGISPIHRRSFLKNLL